MFPLCPSWPWLYHPLSLFSLNSRLDDPWLEISMGYSVFEIYWKFLSLLPVSSLILFSTNMLNIFILLILFNFFSTKVKQQLPLSDANNSSLTYLFADPVLTFFWCRWDWAFKIHIILEASMLLWLRKLGVIIKDHQLIFFMLSCWYNPKYT